MTIVQDETFYVEPKKENEQPSLGVHLSTKGSRWAVYQWEKSGNISTGNKVAEFSTREEARKECFWLNGWKYQAPKS